MGTKEIINRDLYRYFGKSGMITFLKGFLFPGFAYTYFLRKAYGSKGLARLFYRILLRICMIRYGIQIPYTTKIGAGFYIGHFGNIVINDHSIIGENCNVAQGVTIGQANRGKYKGAPQIGNSVWIGPNAVLVGKIIVGDNVLIAPNAYVNIDIPSNSIAIGNPCKIVFNADATSEYITNIK